MADAFDAAGSEVWITDINGESLQKAPAHWHRTQVDACDEDAVRLLFKALKHHWGGLDVLCANAGIAGPTARIEEVALEQWRRCVSVNLEGAMLAAKYAAPMMKAAGQGAMLFSSSTAGIYGYPNRAPYAAAKWGIIGLMKTIAMELGPFGVRANAICPGAVEGPRMEAVLQREAEIKGMSRDAVYKGYAGGTSMRQFVTAQDVAAMAVFLGSDAARLVSGQVIAVDGHTENPDPKL